MKQAAYDFLSYCNQAAQSNVDVTMGWTGYNPYRLSQLNDLAPWVKAGFTGRVGQQLSRRHQGEPEQPEHGVGPEDPGDGGV